jgi:D-alanyl-D-alanine dipeptidase
LPDSLYCLIRFLSGLPSYAKSNGSDMISFVTRTLRYFLGLTLLTSCNFFATAQSAKTATAATKFVASEPKPSDVPPEWTRIVGIYTSGEERVLIYEQNQMVFWRFSQNAALTLNGAADIPIQVSSKGSSLFLSTGADTAAIITLHKDISGKVTELVAGPKTFIRADGGGDPENFYHVTPARPVEELREKALALSPPDEAGPFRKPELVELATLDTAIQLDVRYATARNFLSTPVYTQARAFMQRPAAEALLRTLHTLQPLGYGLLVHDAYRPWYVTKIFWEATPPEGKIFVANPKEGSKHNRGCAVDLTLYDLATGKAIEMPGLYDEMSPRSFPNFPGGTSLQRWHRDLLRRVMESEGFTVNEDEWWHFDYKDWKQYGILNVPFEKLGIGQEPTSVSH